MIPNACSTLHRTEDLRFSMYRSQSIALSDTRGSLPGRRLIRFEVFFFCDFRTLLDAEIARIAIYHLIILTQHLWSLKIILSLLLVNAEPGIKILNSIQLRAQGTKFYRLTEEGEHWANSLDDYEKYSVTAVLDAVFAHANYKQADEYSAGNQR